MKKWAWVVVLMAGCGETKQPQPVEEPAPNPPETKCKCPDCLGKCDAGLGKCVCKDLQCMDCQQGCCCWCPGK